MKHCTHCGKQLGDSEKCTCQAASPATKTRKPKLPIVLSSLAVLLVVLVAVLISKTYFHVKGDSVIDLCDFIVFEEAEGLNGRGSMEYFFDEEALYVILYGEELYADLDDEDFDEVFAEEFGRELAFYQVLECISIESSQTENLSNGDIVNVTVSFENTEGYDIKQQFKGGTISQTITGLKETKKIDVFEKIQLEYSGISGNASPKVQLLEDSAVLNAYDFALDYEGYLSNGDVVTVSISNIDDVGEEYGYIPTEFSKTYTVFGLASYVKDASQLPKDVIAQFVEQFLEDEQPKDDWVFSHSKAEYYTTLFCIRKESSWSTEKNLLQIYICYDRYQDGHYRDTIYIPLQFRNVLASAEGEVILEYSDGYTSIFTTDMDAHMSSLKQDYTVSEVSIALS